MAANSNPYPGTWPQERCLVTIFLALFFFVATYSIQPPPSMRMSTQTVWLGTPKQLVGGIHFRQGIDRVIVYDRENRVASRGCVVVNSIITKLQRRTV